MIQSKLYYDNVWKQGYDQKKNPKLEFNRLKVLKGPTLIYIPLGTYQEVSLLIVNSKSTKI
jgi:hypothetical protein